MTSHAYWGLELTPASRWAGADPSDAYSADVGWWSRQLRPGLHEPRLELRVGQAGTVLLGRVTGPDRRTADRLAAAAREAALDLPGHVAARPLDGGDELGRAIRLPWRPNSVLGVGKHVLQEPALRRAGVSYSAVQPLNAGPPMVGDSTPAELLAAAPAPTLMSCLLVPTPVPAELTERLRRRAAEYDDLDRPVLVPAGIYDAAHTLSPEPFARTGAALFRDAAARYAGTAFRFRCTVASVGRLEPSLVEPLADTVSPPPVLAPRLPVRTDHPMRQVAPTWPTPVTDELPPPASLSAQVAELADPLEAAAIARLPVPTAPRRRGRDGPELFVSYRTDNGDSARLLKSTLDAAFGPDAVFLDADSIRFGSRIEDEVDAALESCVLMLVVIDRDWFRRIREHDPKDRDYVRDELEYGLKKSVLVVPVIWGEMPMPSEDDVPEDTRDLVQWRAIMKGLMKWKAIEVRHPSAQRDLQKLVEDIRVALHGRRRR